MATLFTDENLPLPVAERLRDLGHIVLTIQDAGYASVSLPDPDVLKLAIRSRAALVTLNRRHFIRLHEENHDHAGIIVCTFDSNFAALAQRIHQAIGSTSSLEGQLLRVTR